MAYNGYMILLCEVNSKKEIFSKSQNLMAQWINKTYKYKYIVGTQLEKIHYMG